ncbi:MAG: diphthine--ammonia ligase [Nitrospirae bacterium]|nr:diphthine--ammonia ligase [Nitrospirota bacterium]
MKEKVLFAWSSGKDSARAFFELKQDERYEIAGLMTTVTEGYERISMHGVRLALVEQQAEAMGMPLDKVYIPKESSNESYETAMKDCLSSHKAQGVSAVAFGDLFLEDLKTYREKKLAEAGMKAVFPLWKRDTQELARSFVRLGFKAIVTCVDSQVLDGSFSGRFYDERFLEDLPASVDPCGENGEFHTFVYEAPAFNRPVLFERGGIVIREDRFYFCEIVPL